MSESESRTLPLLPLRDGVLLPGTVATIPVGRAASVALINAVGVGGIVAVGVQFDAAVADPEFKDLHPIAVLARVAKVQRMPRGYQVSLEGLSRVRLASIVGRDPYLQVEAITILDVAVDPLDGTSLVAGGRSGAVAVIAVAERGAMFDPGPVMCE